jgi:hypothetical protein
MKIPIILLLNKASKTNLVLNKYIYNARKIDNK